MHHVRPYMPKSHVFYLDSTCYILSEFLLIGEGSTYGVSITPQADLWRIGSQQTFTCSQSYFRTSWQQAKQVAYNSASVRIPLRSFLCATCDVAHVERPHVKHLAGVPV